MFYTWEEFYLWFEPYFSPDMNYSGFVPSFFTLITDRQQLFREALHGIWIKLEEINLITKFYANKMQLEILHRESKEYECGICINFPYLIWALKGGNKHYIIKNREEKEKNKW